MQIVVVTRVPDPEKDSGNLCSPTCFVLPSAPLSKESGDQLRLAALIHLRVETFALGEILVLDSEYGREVGGKGRKPSKWDVDVQACETLEEAVALAREVTP